MIDVAGLVGTVFSGLSALVIEDVADGGDVIVVRARTREGAVACPGCGTETARVHGYHDRTAGDVPVDGRRVQVRVRARRLRCAAPGLPAPDVPRAGPGRPGALPAAHRPAYRPGQRSGTRISRPGLGPAAAGARHPPPGRPCCVSFSGSRCPRWRCRGCWGSTTSRCAAAASTRPCSSTPRPAAAPAPSRAAPPASRNSGCGTTPGLEVVCRDGSGAYGEAVRRALPGAVQVSDRWHLWHLLAEAVRKEVAAHCACWAKGMPVQDGKRAATTLERWQQVHELRFPAWACSSAPAA